MPGLQTPADVAADHQQAAMQRLGRLLDQAQIQLGCRVAPHLQRHRQLLNEWIEPPEAKRLANA
ncbi:MAG: hypothetical protein ACK550_02360 [Synechococcaceae cyanobacterium]|jgi:hypothetical protein